MKKHLVYSGKNLIAVFDNYNDAENYRNLWDQHMVNQIPLNIIEDDVRFFKERDFNLHLNRFIELVHQKVDEKFKESYSYALMSGREKLLIDTIERLELYENRLNELLYRHNFKAPAIKIEVIEKPLIYDHFKSVLVTKWMADPEKFTLSVDDLGQSSFINLDAIDNEGLNKENMEILENHFVLLEDELTNDRNVLERALI